MTKTGRTILVADDDAAIRTVVTQALTRAGYEVRSTGTAGVLWRWVAAGEGDLVVTDVVMPDENIFDVLPRIRHMRPEIPVIVMSAQNTFMTAIKASERGAYDYLPKPFDLNELVSLVGRALAAAKPVANGEKERPSEDIPLVGRSAAMQDIYRVLARLMQTDLTVIVTGESGTGKELVARALHDFGKRKRGPFVAINMAAIPKDLIESELFGHEKGAFTGAAQRSSGRFEQAEGGTLFLDEIGDMPMEAQTRLLRVLQQGEYTTVGGRTAIRTDVRIVAATNKDLLGLIEQGLFREDLYYRLNVVPIRLPPLRERAADVPDLARHFLKLTEKSGLPRKVFQPEALARLQDYSWPGNVRELENMVRRLVALYPDDVITRHAVEAELADVKRPAFEPAAERQPAGGVEAVRRIPAHPAAHPAGPAEQQSIETAVERHLAEYFQTFGDRLPPPGLYDRILREVERPLIAAALAATRGNQVKAADLLGLNRNTLRKKIKDLNIRMVSTAR